jgi:hypothetical protein
MLAQGGASDERKIGLFGMIFGVFWANTGEKSGVLFTDKVIG